MGKSSCGVLCFCTLLLVLISLLCELLLLWRFLTFRNILHHDDRIQTPEASKPGSSQHKSVKTHWSSLLKSQHKQLIINRRTTPSIIDVFLSHLHSNSSFCYLELIEKLI